MSKERKPTSKRMRFEVFKRDNFECQYCGAKPPKIPLELDHIIPVSKNGKTIIDNLITACFDCNRGKTNIELDSVPTPLIDNMERKKIAQLQYLEFKKILKKEKKIIEEEIDEVEKIFMGFFNGWSFSPSFRITVKKFIKKIGVYEVIESMEISCSKIHNSDDSLKYFCGICWNKIKGE